MTDGNKETVKMVNRKLYKKRTAGLNAKKQTVLLFLFGKLKQNGFYR